MEQTLVLLKPDCYLRKLMGEILSRFERKGLTVCAMKLIRFTSELADQHYAEHVEKPFYPGLKEFIMSAPAVAMVLEGEEAVAVVRSMIGATNGIKANPGTIRGDYGLSGRENSAALRSELLKKLGFPQYMTTNAMLSAVNLIYSKEEFEEILK